MSCAVKAPRQLAHCGAGLCPCERRAIIDFMPLADARRRVDAWRQPRVAARLARVLWIAWAIVVWNVVFDHTIVVAGRDYIAAAAPVAAAGVFAEHGRLDASR